MLAMSRFVPSTPAGPYGQRKNSGAVSCSLNEGSGSTNWRRREQLVRVAHYDAATALTKPFHYMFQKVSDKAIGKKIVHDSDFTFSELVCMCSSSSANRAARQCSLSPSQSPRPSLCCSAITGVCSVHFIVTIPLSLLLSLLPSLPPSLPLQEPATYIGHIVCDGEGHLNASSCLLEGPVRSRTLHSHSVKLEIPNSVPCSLFPGQVGEITPPLPPSSSSLLTGSGCGRCQ